MDWKFEKNMYPILDTRVGMQISFSICTKIQQDKIIYGKLKVEVGKILRDFCERKGIEIIQAECCIYHIHMLVRIPPKYSVSRDNGISKS